MLYWGFEPRSSGLHSGFTVVSRPLGLLHKEPALITFSIHICIVLFYPIYLCDWLIGCYREGNSNPGPLVSLFHWPLGLLLKRSVRVHLKSWFRFWFWLSFRFRTSISDLRLSCHLVMKERASSKNRKSEAKYFSGKFFLNFLGRT